MKRSRIIIVTVSCTFCLVATDVLANEDGVQAAQNALENAARFPWYDRGRDRLEPVVIEQEKPLLQSSDWVWKKRSSRTSSRHSAWEAFWRWMQYGVWFTLAALLAVLIYLWMKAVVRHESGETAAWDEEDRRRHESDSIEQLPFQVKRPQANLLEEARRHYQQGNYRDAIIYLFSYQLVQLDRHQRIHLAKGKTNRQYLFEIGAAAHLHN